MANSYHQIYLHIVFSTINRERLIREPLKTELLKYINKIIQNNESKPICLNAHVDHIHLLVGLNPSIPISDLIRDIKSSSSKWINENRKLNCKFSWQSGYGCFSVSKSSLQTVIKYIETQEEHHKVKSFEDEYLELLKKHGVDYNIDYVF